MGVVSGQVARLYNCYDHPRCAVYFRKQVGPAGSIRCCSCNHQALLEVEEAASDVIEGEEGAYVEQVGGSCYQMEGAKKLPQSAGPIKGCCIRSLHTL